MANSFSKEQIVAFERVGEGFEDQLVMLKNIAVYGTDGVTMERANDTIWRPQPYIVTTQNRVIGTPVGQQSANQLTVPSRLSIKKNVRLQLSATEMRDALQEDRLATAAGEQLATDVNIAVRDVASNEGTLVVPITGAAGDYDDIAACDNIMNETGVPQNERYLVLTSRDYNGMAGNLAAATRSFGNAKSDNAYERSLVGDVAGFMTFKTDAGRRLAAAGGGGSITINTTGAQVRFVPRSTDETGVNVDNRYQRVTLSSTANVRAGDAFTIAGIENVHMKTKESSGQLKTFRVVALVPGTDDAIISPPIIGANLNPTDAERQYKNCEVVSTSATASINWLNDNAAGVNPFWYRDSIELLPGRYAVPSGQGAEVMRMTLEGGIELTMTKQFNPETYQSDLFFDIFFGVVNKNPEMNGILLFGQP